MIVSNVLGGLGNQMFQYATGRALALRSKQEFKIDISSFDHYILRKFEIDKLNTNFEIASLEEIEKLKYAKKTFLNYLYTFITNNKRFGNNYCKEKFFYFDESILNISGEKYLFGYWQSEKYFKDIKEVLLEEFTPITPLHNESLRYLENIEKRNSISLHIRRGDYITNATTNQYHGVCSLSYYRQAVERILESEPEAYFCIFSDDIEWAKNNLNFMPEFTYIELSKNIPDYEELFLMSYCKHNIIANSSFSWWGAWLNKNPEKKVIAPKQWFKDRSIQTKDLLPDDWIKL